MIIIRLVRNKVKLPGFWSSLRNITFLKENSFEKRGCKWLHGLQTLQINSSPYATIKTVVILRPRFLLQLMCKFVNKKQPKINFFVKSTTCETIFLTVNYYNYFWFQAVFLKQNNFPAKTRKLIKIYHIMYFSIVTH